MAKRVLTCECISGVPSTQSSGPHRWRAGRALRSVNGHHQVRRSLSSIVSFANLLEGQVRQGVPKRFPFGASLVGGSIVAGARTHVSERSAPGVSKAGCG